MMWRLKCVMAGLTLGLVGTNASADSTPNSISSIVDPFIQNYCIECHSDDEPKGDRSFEELANDISNDNTLVDFQDILDQLNLSEMPPPESDQPSDQDRMQVIETLTTAISKYHASHQEHRAHSILRRLNAREYRNSVRDLLAIDVTMFDPTERFPRDQTVDHLDNIGDTLVTSSHLLSRYLDAADAVINRAIYPIEKPAKKTWSFRENFRQQPEIDNVHRRFNGFKHMTLYDVVGADKPEGAYGPILALADGVPFDGVYEIRFQAEALNRDHPYDDDLIGTDRGQPFRLGIVPGNRDDGELHMPQPNEPLLAEIELADQPSWYSVRVPLDRGYTPRFTFQNGLMDARNLWTKLVKTYPDQFEKGISGIVEYRNQAITRGKLPQIRIYEIEITGPLIDQWPTKSQHAVLGDDFETLARGESISKDQIRSRVESFASRAYRRPATDDEINQIVDVIDSRIAAGESAIDAIADGCKMVLCSPNFLYLENRTIDDAQHLSQHALANRLSYFLWSSTPDQTLRNLADTGRLDNDQVLRRQVNRMLADPKSEAMLHGFLDAWLALSDLGSAPPDRGDFRDFYRHDLGTAMRTETELFFRNQLDKNLPIDNFIDSDFTFVNTALANLYGVDAPLEPGFHRVQLSDRRRGGLLGQASVLTVSANGIDTSPVVRGVWMLENFLGTPPSPPPPDVQPLDPDTRGATSIRDQLSKHRDIATCFDCHRKIDPLGFALENYDPIGRWRDSYSKRTKIDASGELPDGKSFRDVRELKTILISRKAQFSRALTTKMLAYATGRLEVLSDRPAIEKIASSANGTRDLVIEVVLSEPFRTK
ncbi:DUF1592 domain-containing protein [Rubripirellula reticaptiva]|uniref:Planctomycete cytochrome C n=1 Tax=Rubripirellula reticaptiva TaxID=2528013 RepID=A0A5C6EIL0_9BACT|nr:DUF1592 domain-containing protein [Rubripirellula reticaptiva]TWU47099.1 hypothetical protein Poly59_60730 [Rubripirellula reticaptiva]